MMRFAPDGYPFIFGFFFVTGVISIVLFVNLGSGRLTFYSLLFSFCLFFSLTIFMAFFFRDPERKIPGDENIFVSPADGKVISIKDVYEENYLKSESKEISIFMSPLDVHVNRAPCDGQVSIVKYSPGRFMAAYKDEASMNNENIVMVLHGKEGRVVIRQVAGFLARRTVCRAKLGDLLKRGDRYGIIKFGSRLDVYLPKDATIMVKLGDKVKAGETIIGKAGAKRTVVEV
jgi:phosphatidylserine decarboxylase